MPSRNLNCVSAKISLKVPRKNTLPVIIPDVSALSTILETEEASSPVQLPPENILEESLHVNDVTNTESEYTETDFTETDTESASFAYYDTQAPPPAHSRHKSRSLGSNPGSNLSKLPQQPSDSEQDFSSKQNSDFENVTTGSDGSGYDYVTGPDDVTGKQKRLRKSRDLNALHNSINAENSDFSNISNGNQGW